MIIDGETFKVKENYKPKTQLAFSWGQLSSRRYYPIDRGSSQDLYQADIEIYSTEGVIDSFLDKIEASRQDDVTISFETGEKFFGADIDYTNTIDCIVEPSFKRQNTWKGFPLTVRLTALSPTFTGSPSLPVFKYLSHGYEADAEWTINRQMNYDVSINYSDHDTDKGIFRGEFTFNDSEMKALRRYYAINRGSNVSITGINGVTYPFGARRAGSYPYTVKILKLSERPYASNRWRCNVEFAEV
jgi:hypothetical protein